MQQGALRQLKKTFCVCLLNGTTVWFYISTSIAHLGNTIEGTSKYTVRQFFGSIHIFFIFVSDELFKIYFTVTMVAQLDEFGESLFLKFFYRIFCML